MSEVGCAERTPSEARSADDLYIGVRSALIYQKSGDFRVNVNKVKLRGIAYSYTKRFLPFFRKKACAEKIKFEEHKKMLSTTKNNKNFTCVKLARRDILTRTDGKLRKIFLRFAFQEALPAPEAVKNREKRQQSEMRKMFEKEEFS